MIRMKKWKRIESFDGLGASEFHDSPDDIGLAKRFTS